MRTHTHITDKYLRSEIAWVLLYFKNLLPTLLPNECRYLSYPIHSSLYVTYDFQDKKVTEIEYQNGKIIL